MRFSLIDRITEIEAGKSITATKNLSLAEEYLQDHFPGFPVMPGVLMLESLVQTSSWLMRFSEDFAYSTVLLKTAKAVKFNSFLTPGDTLVVNSKVHKTGETEYTFKAAGTVNGTSTVSARLILRQFNLSETNAEMAESDKTRIQGLRENFAVLCPESVHSPAE